ncbi:MAG: hypothetical protein CSA15_08140 [Candidatus Delongbacteria bacterium]|nr:MAG: hypothetical protein CSA15_08140 [Candidatus Delongbacteria bacterium]
MNKLKPWRVTIDTNPDICNLKCIMCDTHSIYNKHNTYNREEMPKELLEKCLNQVLNLGVKEIIPTTMGEPLMYKHMDVFVSYISNSTAKLNLTTNGTFPRKNIEQWSKILLPILSDIKISINSINPNINEKIMCRDNTRKKIEDIKIISRLRDKFYPNVSITLQVTFLKQNIPYLEELICFAIDHGLNRVKGHQLWVNYDCLNSESLEFNNENRNLWNDFIDKVDKYRKYINLVNFNKLNLDNFKSDVNKNSVCPFLGKELWIDYEGNFNICCAPSEKRRELGYWGNIKEKSISEIFNSEQYLKLLKNYKNFAVCKICPLKRSAI